MNRIATTAAATIIGGFALLALTACQSGLQGAGAPQVVVSQVAATGSLAADVTPVASTPTTSATHQSSAATAEPVVAAGAVALGSGAASGSAAATITAATVTATHSSTATTTTTTKPATGPGSGSGQGTGAKSGAGNGSGTGHQSTTSGSDAGTPAPASARPSIVSASISCDLSSDDQTYHENLSYEVANATGMALSIDNPGIVGSFGSYDWHGTIEIPSLGCYSINGPQTYTLYTIGGTGPQASKTIIRTGTHTAITPPPFAETTPNTSSQLPTPSAASQLPTPSAASSTTTSTTGN